jgi:cytoskeletal protein CcmA (bactofilin family)
MLMPATARLSTGAESRRQERISTPAHRWPIANPPEPVSSDPDARPTHSTLDSWLNITGNLQSDGDIQVDGHVKGDIRCARLTVGKGATIVGNIAANEITVRGSIKGIIRATRVTLQNHAHVESEIIHKTLIIEEGAWFAGVSRAQDDPMRMTSDEIVRAATEGGGDPIALHYFVRPLLSMPDDDRRDPVEWARELSVAVASHDQEVFAEAVAAIATRGKPGPISEMVEECARIDSEIGGQKSMSLAMHQMYALGERAWNAKWGPLPGQPGCRLRRERQDHHWRDVIEVARGAILQRGRPKQPADLIGLEIIERLEQNSGESLDLDGRCPIPRRIRVEFSIPTSAKAIKEARTLLAASRIDGRHAAKPGILGRLAEDVSAR